MTGKDKRDRSLKYSTLCQVMILFFISDVMYFGLLSLAVICINCGVRKTACPVLSEGVERPVRRELPSRGLPARSYTCTRDRTSSAAVRRDRLWAGVGKARCQDSLKSMLVPGFHEFMVTGISLTFELLGPNASRVQSHSPSLPSVSSDLFIPPVQAQDS